MKQIAPKAKGAERPCRGLWAFLEHPVPGMEMETLLAGTAAAGALGLVVTSQACDKCLEPRKSLVLSII